MHPPCMGRLTLKLCGWRPQPLQGQQPSTALGLGRTKVDALRDCSRCCIDIAGYSPYSPASLEATPLILVRRVGLEPTVFSMSRKRFSR